MTRIAFAGGRPPGIACFKRLLSSDAEVVAVFANPEDRNREHWYSGPTVSDLAREVGIPVFDPLYVETLQSLDVDLLIVVYYDTILKPDVLAVPRWGCVNLHLGLAERYRGAHPTTWALWNGDCFAGATLHYIDEGIDTGPIIADHAITIVPEDTGRSLYERVMAVGVQLFDAWLPKLLQGRVASREQVATEYTRTHYRKDFPGYEVLLPTSVYNHLRALIFPPFPMPYIVIGRKRYRLVEEDNV